MSNNVRDCLGVTLKRCIVHNICHLCCSSTGDSRLLNIIHELKSYKKRLAKKVDYKERCEYNAQCVPGIELG